MKTIITFAITTFIIIGGFLIFHIYTTQIASTPQSNPIKLSALSQPFNIITSQPIIFNSAISTEISPQVETTTLSRFYGKSITLTPKPDNFYEFDTVYQVKVFYFGRLIGETYFIGPPKPSNPALEQNDLDIAVNFPLAAYLPLKQSNLKVDYVAAKTLRIITSLTEKEAISKVRDYASSKHVDISDHQFRYQREP